MAWRCTGPCGQLIYNIERENYVNYPVDSEPKSKFISLLYPKVCLICFQLYVGLEDSPYWKKMAEEVTENNKKARDGDDGRYYPRIF